METVIEQPTKTVDSEMNWFGEKVGAEKVGRGVAGGGVGKYLQLGGAAPVKRPAATPAAPGVAEEPKKKRKIGFGQFEGW